MIHSQFFSVFLAIAIPVSILTSDIAKENPIKEKTEASSSNSESNKVLEDEIYFFEEIKKMKQQKAIFSPKKMYSEEEEDLRAIKEYTEFLNYTNENFYSKHPARYQKKSEIELLIHNPTLSHLRSDNFFDESYLIFVITNLTSLFADYYNHTIMNLYWEEMNNLNNKKSTKKLRHNGNFVLEPFNDKRITQKELKLMFTRMLVNFIILSCTNDITDINLFHIKEAVCGYDKILKILLYNPYDEHLNAVWLIEFPIIEFLDPEMENMKTGTKITKYIDMSIINDLITIRHRFLEIDDDSSDE